MATYRLIFDTRGNKEGKGTLSIMLRAHSKSTTMALGLPKLEEWQFEEGKVTNHPDKNRMNKVIKNRLRKVEDAIDYLVDNEKAVTIETIKEQYYNLMGVEYIERNKPVNKQNLLLTRIEHYANLHDNERTREIYMQTYRHIKMWQGIKADRLLVTDVTKEWLRDFNRYLIVDRQQCNNTAAIHHRNLRAVLNEAIDDGYIRNNPYRKFTIKTDATRKRDLSIMEIKELISYPVEKHQERYRDIFVLMVYLIGINPIDLLCAKHTDVRRNRLEYRRQKTGSLYSVLIPDEAWEIINKYKGKTYLLDVCENVKDYRNFTKRMNMELKRIGSFERKGLGGKKYFIPLFPNLTCYWARHTWASIASKIGHNKEVIGHALGHTWANTVTDIYIDFDRGKVDRAQLDVIKTISG